MKNIDISLEAVAGRVRWAAVAIVILILVAVGSLIPIQIDSLGDWFAVALLVVGLSSLAYLLSGNWIRLSAMQNDLQKNLLASEKRVDDFQARLTTLQKINRILTEAEGEQPLMERILEVVGELVGAQAVSYIPLDEWGEPLASILKGEAPPHVVDTWSAYLRSADVKQVCMHCQVLHSNRGGVCPLACHPFTQVEGIFCFRIQRGDRLLGMLNLYLPPPGTLSDESRCFLDSLLAELALAVETVRLRNQELVTLRQLQLLRNPRIDISELLSSLLENLRLTLEVEHATVIVRTPGKAPLQLVLGSDLSDPLQSDSLEPSFEGVVESGEPMVILEGGSVSLPTGIASLLIVPIGASSRKPVGIIALGRSQRFPFHPPEIRVAEVVANQAAFIIENEQLMNEMEYKAVIGERTRLAREIHDGLAQTLAFLKLQISQLQITLNRGDLDRSRDIVRLSHQTLSEAYLDARQAIDNLRITPEIGVQHWLEQAVHDIQSTTGLVVHLSVDPSTPELLPEVQAQLIRVVQEALSNIRKHAHATEVEISLRRWQSDWILEIKDNGRGFSPDEVPSLSQYGLRGMRERAELIGADFQIISQPNRGTVVRLYLPNPIEETPV